MPDAKRLTWGLLATVVFLGVPAAVLYLKFGSSYDLPSDKIDFASIKPKSSAELFDRSGRVFAYRRNGARHLIYKPLSQIPDALQQFVVQAEDAKFFSHDGFDLGELKNALKSSLDDKKRLRGASTISQQLAKNLFLDGDRSLERKAFEVPWTMRLERDLSKKQILELYLNIIEWGPGVYGVEAASRHYFGVAAQDLRPGQMLYLTMIIPNPIRFDLFKNPGAREFLEEKKSRFLDRLVSEKQISPSERDEYLNDAFALVPPDDESRTFPAFHNAQYFGNWREWDIAIKILGSKASEVDRTLMMQLMKLPQTPGPSKKARNVFILEDGVIRAVRQIPAKKDIDQNSLSLFLESGDFQVEFKEIK